MENNKTGETEPFYFPADPADYMLDPTRTKRQENSYTITIAGLPVVPAAAAAEASAMIPDAPAPKPLPALGVVDPMA